MSRKINEARLKEKEKEKLQHDFQFT